MTKQFRTRIKRPANYISKLEKSNGAEKTAQELGVTRTAVRRYVEAKEAPQAIEMAAEMIWSRRHLKPPKEVITVNKETAALIQGDPELMKAVKVIIETANGEFKILR